MEPGIAVLVSGLSHPIFYLDYYLSDDTVNFLPPAPFTLSELDPSVLMPDRVYNKAELLNYLEFGRKKCHDLIAEISFEDSEKRFVNADKDYSIFEIMLYNMRHVQHHAAQLNQLLRQGGSDAPRWVSRTKVQL